MRFLVRGEGCFLEASLKNGELTPTGTEVDPKTLVHFGSDLKSKDQFNLQRYVERMKGLGVDYLLVPQTIDDVEYGQSGKCLGIYTDYLKR